MADEAQIAYAAHYLSDPDNNSLNIGESHIPVYFVNGVPVKCTNFLPLSAGEDYKLTGSLGLTEDYMYGKGLPETGFTGQLFFKEDDSLYIPKGGTAGQVLIKNGPIDGDASWKELVALPKGGNAGQILIKNSNTDGDASWKELVTLPEGGTSGQVLIKNSNTNGDASWKELVTLPKGGNQGQIIVKNSSNEGDASWQDFPSLNYLPLNGGTITDTTESTSTSTGAVVINGGLGVKKNIYGFKVYGAVWNDYAEYRNQNEIIKPGYCVASADNGQVYRTTKKFQACDGIVSDTFGFAIGETDECKTPLAVAGRVLAYCEGDKYSYHSGDTVCAGPNGKVCKMTREEIREWPDRIIGIVSEIPEYETWGTGNIPVNGRIWIKIK